MRCRDVRDRLVAYQDRELAPGEDTQVREHLGGCPDCAGHEARLAAASPTPCVAPGHPDDASLWARLDAALERELDDPAPPARRSLTARAVDWLGLEARVPMGAMLAYTVVLVVAVGWGLQGWLVEPAGDPSVATATGGPPSHEIPADQFRPASWIPPEVQAPAAPE